MKLFKIISLLGLSLLLLTFTRSFAQKRDLIATADSIMTEANELYKSEWASWYGGDIFAEKCKDKKNLVGGYLSYDTGKGLNNVYFSNSPNPVIVATISFGYDLKPANYKLDIDTRELSPIEKELFTIRKSALADLNSDTLYKKYNNTSLNPVPIITNKNKRVYVLTGPSINGVVIIGNDYLLSFDANNTLINKKTLHKNIIPVQIPKANDPNIQIGSMHTHLPATGDFITATDICTLMLYEKFTTWNQHIVLSKDYTSIWDCKNDKLTILTKEDWDKKNVLQNALKNKTN